MALWSSCDSTILPRLFQVFMIIDSSLEFISTDKRNTSSLSLLRSFSCDFKILEFFGKRGRYSSGCEALHDGKTNDLYDEKIDESEGTFYCPS